MSASSNFPVIVTGNSQLDRIQANIQKALSPQNSPFVGGRLLTGIALSANSAKSVNHLLGRQPQIWIICDLSGTDSPSVSGTTTLSPNPYTPAGTVSGSTFTGTPQSFSLSGSFSSHCPSVWRTAWDSQTITLEAGSDCTISVWVN